jgi:hypothetical protein
VPCDQGSKGRVGRVGLRTIRKEWYRTRLSSEVSGRRWRREGKATDEEVMREEKVGDGLGASLRAVLVYALGQWSLLPTRAKARAHSVYHTSDSAGQSFGRGDPGARGCRDSNRARHTTCRLRSMPDEQSPPQQLVFPLLARKRRTAVCSLDLSDGGSKGPLPSNARMKLRPPDEHCSTFTPQYSHQISALPEQASSISAVHSP